MKMTEQETDINQVTKNWNILRLCRQHKEQNICDLLIQEISCQMRLNGEEVVVFHCCPRDLKELCVGHAFTKHLLTSANSIQKIKVSTKGDQVDVYTYAGVSCQLVQNQLSSEQNSRDKTYGQSQTLDCEYIQISEICIFQKIRQLEAASELFRKTGASHSIGLADQNEFFLCKEDVARHNALDKVIGAMLLAHISGDGKMFLFSGRVALDMVEKVAATNVKIIAAIGAPTYQAVELAKKHNITICGFVRNNKMNVYCGAERIVSN